MKRFYLAENLIYLIIVNSTVIIFSDFEGLRLHYTLKLVFEQMLGIKYSITKKIDEANIIYSENASSQNSINIKVCSNLLKIRGYEPIEVNYKFSGDKTILFPLENNLNNFWAFDLFSAIFYLVSRHEEYSDFTPDLHNRFPPEESILCKTDSIEFPLVNIWVNKLKVELLSKFSELKFQESKFSFISTIDIDSTFKYKEKNFIRTLGGLAKDIINLNFSDVFERSLTLLRIKKDSFDIYKNLNLIHKKYSTEVIFFWLLGDFGKFDKNISWKNKFQKNIIKSISKNYKIGIHPSYKSNFETNKIKIEKSRLEKIINSRLEISRQHFLMHRFPQTYQNLIIAGVKNDYTMGYTSRYGFRAGIASPFYFYELNNDCETDLKLFPFCSMDITPMFYFKLNVEQAKDKNLELLKKVKNVNGTFISLWHNESISGTGRWQGGWATVYEQLLKDADELLKT